MQCRRGLQSPLRRPQLPTRLTMGFFYLLAVTCCYYDYCCTITYGVEAFQTATRRASLSVTKHTILSARENPSATSTSLFSSQSSSPSTSLWRENQRKSQRSTLDDLIASSTRGQSRSAFQSAIVAVVTAAVKDSSAKLSHLCHQLRRCILEQSARIHQLDYNVLSTNAKLFFQRLVVAVKYHWKEYWWTSPMLLLVVPLYCGLFLQSHASMPSWWSVTNMDHVHRCSAAAASATATASASPSTLLSSTAVVLGTFLGSNIAYFVSSVYLAIRFGMIRLKRRPDNALVSKFQWPPVVPNFAFLSLWTGTAGVVSTIFHSVQAFCGNRGFAETLCYIDHAVAITAICYFWKTCGRPTTTVSLIGAVALLTLVVTEPGYAFLHSSWHLLSAIAATRWALDGYARRIQRHKRQLKN
jgi:hypothetical protein